MVLQGQYQLLVVKAADNQNLELIFVCSKSENNDVKILNNGNFST